MTFPYSSQKKNVQKKRVLLAAGLVALLAIFFTSPANHATIKQLHAGRLGVYAGEENEAQLRRPLGWLLNCSPKADPRASSVGQLAAQLAVKDSWTAGCDGSVLRRINRKNPNSKETRSQLTEICLFVH